MIIQDINTIGTSLVEFLHKSRRCWRVREHIGPRATSIDPMCIKKLDEDKVEEHHLMEA
jgi:hypothetical protein